MSTTRSGASAVKKISSCVRPGVCEVRASALREVSPLIRLDLPTFERPANAISTPFIGGSRSAVPAAAANCQSAVNSLRPASISAAVSYAIVLTKADQVTQVELAVRAAAVSAALAKRPAAFPDVAVTSARTGAGIPELRAAIGRLVTERTAS